MARFNRGISHREEGFESIEIAREAARAWKRELPGRKIVAGGEIEAGGWFEGTVDVWDTDKYVAGDFGCGRCAQTGQFITGSLNGKPTGPGGSCFRCNGKGYHDQADRKRNAYHDEQAWAAEGQRLCSSGATPCCGQQEGYNRGDGYCCAENRGENLAAADFEERAYGRD